MWVLVTDYVLGVAAPVPVYVLGRYNKCLDDWCVCILTQSVWLLESCVAFCTWLEGTI